MESIKKKLVAGILILILLPVFCFALDDSAMVIDIGAGSVYYNSGDLKGKSVQILDFLSIGDRLKLEDNARLLLNYFESGSREEIQGSGVLEIGNKKSDPATTLLVKSETAFALPGKAVMEIRDLQHMGTTVLRSAKPKVKRHNQMGKILPLTLSDINVKNKHPLFSWKAVDDADKYRIQLWDGSDSLHDEVETRETTWRYGKNDLTDGELYWWTVLAFSNDRIIAKGDGIFSLLSQDKRMVVEEKEREIMKQCGESEVEQMLHQFVLYQQYDLLDDSVAFLKMLYAKYPKNENIERWLEVLNGGSKKGS
ncbi:MAG: hypothetical protein U9N77_04595 [Thermodesulfobacteriota bacterium]|nr:hypothetical protein [Thermodesulfobacteriota bacterium]